MKCNSNNNNRGNLVLWYSSSNNNKHNIDNSSNSSNMIVVTAAARTKQQEQNRTKYKLKQRPLLYNKYSFSNTKQRSFQYHTIHSYHYFIIGQAIDWNKRMGYCSSLNNFGHESTIHEPYKSQEFVLTVSSFLVFVLYAPYIHARYMHHTCTIHACTIHAQYMHRTCTIQP